MNLSNSITHSIHVGIGELAISSNSDDTLIAANLGSCLGISVYDPKLKLGGLIHCMLPLSRSNPDKADEKPATYVDTGVVLLLSELVKRGSNKKDFIVTVVGGSNINDTNNVFEIGKKNYTMFRKVMWKNGLLIKAEDVGEHYSRTICLEVGSGAVWLKAQGTNTRLV